MRVDATARVALFREKRADEETSFLKPSSSFVFLATVSSGKKDIILSGVFVVLRGSREKKRRDKNGIENVIVSTEYLSLSSKLLSFKTRRERERKRERKSTKTRTPKPSSSSCRWATILPRRLLLMSSIPEAMGKSRRKSTRTKRRG